MFHHLTVVRPTVLSPSSGCFQFQPVKRIHPQHLLDPFKTQTSVYAHRHSCQLSRILNTLSMWQTYYDAWICYACPEHYSLGSHALRCRLAPRWALSSLAVPTALLWNMDRIAQSGIAIARDAKRRHLKLIIDKSAIVGIPRW